MGDLPLVGATKEALTTRRRIENVADLSTRVAGLGANEKNLHKILSMEPVSFPTVKPSFFPRDDRSSIAFSLCVLVDMGRSLRSRDFGLASLLLGSRPSLGRGGIDGWKIDDVIDAEVDNMQKAFRRVQKCGLNELPRSTAQFFLNGCFLQATPGQPMPETEEQQKVIKLSR